MSTQWNHDLTASLLLPTKIPKLMTVASLTLVCVLYTFALVVPTASQYEISIYNQYPLYFWLLSMIVLSVSTLSLITGKDLNVQVGSGISAISILVLLSIIPHLRGYYLYGGGDMLKHIGTIKNIILTGGVGSTVYPFTHVFASITAIVVNLDIVRLSGYVHLFWLVSVPLFIILLSKMISSNKEKIIVSFAFIILSIFGLRYHHIEPSRYSRFLFPLVIFLTYATLSRKDKRYLVGLILILMIYPFLHPITLVHICFVLIILYLIIILDDTYLSGIFDRWQGDSINLILLSALGLIVGFRWVTKSRTFQNKLQTQVTQYFINRESVTSGSLASKANSYIGIADPIDIISLAIYQFGSVMILYSVVGFIMMYLLYTKTWNGNACFKATCILFLIISPTFVIGKFISIPLYIPRMNTFALLFAIALLPVLISKINITSTQKLKLVSVGLVILVVTLSFFAVFTTYNGSMNRSPNQQTTEMEFSGSSWFVNNHNANVPTRERGIKMVRFSAACCGQSNQIASQKANPHFKYSSEGASTTSHYLLTSRKGRIAYPKLYPDYKNFWEFTPDDFDQLQAHKETDRVYSNGDVNVYLRY